MVSPFRARPGVSLVESVVALTILTIGLLGALGTQLLAARILREAEARTDAVNLASSILDSLSTVPSPVPGEVEEGRFRARWRVVPAGGLSLIELEIGYDDGTAHRELRFESMHAPPLSQIRVAGQ